MYAGSRVVFVIVRDGALIYPNNFVGYLGGAVEVKSRTDIKYSSCLPMAMLHKLVKFTHKKAAAGEILAVTEIHLNHALVALNHHRK